MAEKQPEIKATNLTKEDEQFLEENADELSKSTLRAKWIHSSDEQPDRDGQTLATRSHEVIRSWAEARDLRPATVPGTEHGDRRGVLRLITADNSSDRLEAIGWMEWFKPFDERQLVFIYQERKSDGTQSNFFRLDSPEREDG